MNNRQLNIVFFPQSVNFGLAGTNRLQNIIYFLQKHDVTSIANIALEPKASQPIGMNGSLFLNNYKEICYGPSVTNFISHIFKTCRYLHKFKKPGHKNIIYFYGEVDIKNFYFLLWAKILGYKTVIDVVEDLETITTFKSFKNRLKYKSAIFFRKHLNYFADGFITLSDHLTRLIKTRFSYTPLFFLPVTVNKYLLAANNGTTGSKPFTIFYSGSFNEKDGLPYLLKGLAGLKSCHNAFRLVLSGRGTDLEMNNFQNEVKKLDLSNEVVYKGLLSRKDYVGVLAEEADVLCMTRINSAFANAGFPFKLGEFLATGKPVIASKVGDVEKYLSAGDAYLVAPEDADQITDSLLNIINNAEAARKKGLNGKLVAMKYFDHENYAAGLITFFNQI